MPRRRGLPTWPVAHAAGLHNNSHDATVDWRGQVHRQPYRHKVCDYPRSSFGTLERKMVRLSVPTNIHWLDGYTWCGDFPSTRWPDRGVSSRHAYMATRKFFFRVKNQSVWLVPGQPEIEDGVRLSRIERARDPASSALHATHCS